MKKADILYYIILGNTLINVPIIIFCWYELFWPVPKLDFINLIFVLGISFTYWSILIPHYRLFCIKKFKNTEEYRFWQKWSINTMLFWSDEFSFTMECWDKRNLKKYIEIKNSLSSEI